MARTNIRNVGVPIFIRSGTESFIKFWNNRKHFFELEPQRNYTIINNMI